MKRSLIFIFISVLFCDLTFGQSWEDSLRTGIKLYQEKNYEKAYQALLSAQKLAPSEVDLSQDIGNAAYRNEDFEMAEKAFRVAAENTNDKSIQAENWHNVGNSQMKAKNYQAAVESYKEALRKMPNAEQSRYNLTEAKRRLALQKEQQKKQDQQKQNQEGNKDQNKNNKPTHSEQGQNQSKENSEENNQAAGQSKNGDQNNEKTAKLSDQMTERMLEELLKQEMQTKKKVQGIKSRKNGNNTKSGKKW